MSLREVFCQDRAIGLLQRAYLSGRVANAYIFAGVEGVGKSTVARAWAKLLLCKRPVVEDGVEGKFVDSCGECSSCRLFETGSHPDYHPVYKELRSYTEQGRGRGAGVEVGIDVIRQFLVERLYQRPRLSDRRVFVVSEAEKLNVASQNCLLKTLEEPPSYCCIVLLCTRLEDLLPTTKSRCQIVGFGPIDEERIVGRLLELGLEESVARSFARLSEGSLGVACQWALLENKGVGLYQIKRQLVDGLVGLDLEGVCGLAEQLVEWAREVCAGWAAAAKDAGRADLQRRAVKMLLRLVAAVFRDVMRDGWIEAGEMVNFEQPDAIGRLSERFSPEQAARIVMDCYELLRWVDANVNERLVFERLLFQVAGCDRIRL